MTIDGFLSLLDNVRRSGQGWMARCPSREDRTPSLKVDEGDDGRILLHDFGGASVEEICGALGIGVRDLFPDPAYKNSPSPSPLIRRPTSAHRPRTWRRWSSDLKYEAESYWLCGTKILSAATEKNLSGWDDLALDIALTAVSLAHDDLELADQLEDQAFLIRVRALARESGRRSHAA